MTTAVDWLPLDALSSRPLQDALDAALAAWSQRWLRDAPLRMQQLRSQKSALADDAGAGWLAPSRGIAVKLAPADLARLSGLALRAPSTVRTSTDLELLTRFETAMVQDLVEVVAERLGPVDPGIPDGLPGFAQGAAVAAVAEESGAPLAWIAVARPAAARILKRGLAPCVRSTAMPPLSRTLAATPVVLQAVLGRAQLNLDAVIDLAPGDVVVLDTGPDDPVEVGLPRAGVAAARARLVEAGDRLALQFL